MTASTRDQAGQHQQPGSPAGSQHSCWQPRLPGVALGLGLVFALVGPESKPAPLKSCPKTNLLGTTPCMKTVSAEGWSPLKILEPHASAFLHRHSHCLPCSIIPSQHSWTWWYTPVTPGWEAEARVQGQPGQPGADTQPQNKQTHKPSPDTK